MNAEENKKLILAHYESFVHQQDAESARKQLAADFRDHEMPPGNTTWPRGRSPVPRHASQGISRSAGQD
jgi:hypothetical protein